MDIIRPIPSRRTRSTFIGVGLIVAIIAQIAIVIAVIWVAAHFIAKFW